MDPIEIKLDDVEEKIVSLIQEKFAKNPPGVGGLDKESAKDAKSFYTEQAKAAKALREATEKQLSFMEKVQREASASFTRNVGIPGVFGAGGSEEDSGYKPKGFSGESGIFSQLKGALTKQLPESIQVGIAGGMAAGGVLALAEILGDAISQSKILTTIFGTIGKALGLLIDVILLPFLPILITGIIWLYQGIMEFHKLWSGIWSAKTFQNLVSGVSALGTAIAKGIGGLLTLGINFLSGAASAAWSVLQWIWGLATKNTAINLALSFLLGPVGLLLNWLYFIITGKQTPTMTLMMQVAGAAVGFLQWLWNTITSGGANLVVNVTQSAGNVVSGAMNSVNSMLSSAGGFLSNLLHFDSGGTVPGTGPQLAVVHGGETITPKGQASGHTFIFNGYNDAQLQRSVENILRRQNNRYNA